MKRRRNITLRTYALIDELTASATSPMPEARRMHQLSVMWQGLAAMERAQTPEKSHWRVCSDAINIMETLVEMGVLQDSQGLLNDAVTAMAMAGKRNLAGGQIRPDGAGIHAVRAILEDYASALEQLTERVVIRAHRLTETRIQEILRGKRRPHDVEVTEVVDL
jgi:hypothetical protein